MCIDGRIRNLSSENQCERSIDTAKVRRVPVHNCRWYSKIARKRLRIPRTHSKAGTNREELGEAQLAESQDDAEASADFWSIQGDFVYRHHNEPRVQLYVSLFR